MSDAAVDAFIKHFAAIEDPAKRERLLAQVKLKAVDVAPESAFEPPIRTLGKYLSDPIEVPPTLVDPYIVVRGGMTCTIGRAGKGKMQPYSSKIMTPHGWTMMGEISVGDLVVDPATGRSATVSGKYPQGVKDVYRVTFCDGSSADAGAEHLWRVTDRHGAEKTVTTLELRPSYGVQTTRSFDLPTADNRPLDPWLLGFLLGDGCLVRNTITFSTADQEVVDRVRALEPTTDVVPCGGCDYRIRGGLVLDHVRQLGIAVKSPVKRVPSQYMTGTAASRLEVLRGLMDADGHASGQFCSMSRGLVEDVIELTRSLGGVASLHAQRPNGAWRTVVRLRDSPFWLTRKDVMYTKRGTSRYVRTVEPVGQAECACIMVNSSSHLYITDDYIVTHNTVMNLNRLLKWSAGKPMFDGWHDADGNTNLAPTKPLKILIIENEGAGGLFHRQVGIMLHADGYLDAEDRELARENILIWGDGGYSGLKLDDKKKLAEVRRGCEVWEPDVVFVEPFRGLWNGEENSATDMAVVIDALVEIAADYKCGVMLAHHERKSGTGEDGEKMSAGRGSTVLEGAVTVMENFESAKGGEYRELSWSKSRHGKAPNPVRMEWDPDAWWYKWCPSSDMDEAFIEALRDNADEPMNLKSLSEELGEPVTKLRPVADRLVKDGKVKKMASVSSQNGSTGARFRLPTADSGYGGLSV